MAKFGRVLQEDILPLLEEYCYEDWEALARILGEGLVDVAERRFRQELFAINRQDELVQAILAATPDVSASAIAVAVDAATQTADEPEDDPDTDDDAEQETA